MEEEGQGEVDGRKGKEKERKHGQTKKQTGQRKMNTRKEKEMREGVWVKTSWNVFCRIADRMAPCNGISYCVGRARDISDNSCVGNTTCHTTHDTDRR